VAISLDGVMVPMKDGGGAQKRQDAKDQDQHTRGPAGYQEVGCGTLSFYDAEGVRLSTVRLARMPEKHKATLKDTLSQELAAVLGQRPDLTLVKLADGAKDNWSHLAVLPQGIEIIDFYHACEHLKAAFDAAYGENSSRSKAQFEKYRHLLRDEHDGVAKVIRALCHSETPTRARESSRPSLPTSAATVTACAMRRHKRSTSPLVQGSWKPRARHSRPNG
jgi:hypothetical protein